SLSLLIASISRSLQFPTLISRFLLKASPRRMGQRTPLSPTIFILEFPQSSL
ncbi:hypothetical protein BX616_002492, partial [Lobosporangium transversale]